jgi:hypothetical protein
MKRYKMRATFVLSERVCVRDYKSFQLSQDYGTLLCWGSNEMGMQTEPCVFNIIPAGK